MTYCTNVVSIVSVDVVRAFDYLYGFLVFSRKVWCCLGKDFGFVEVDCCPVSMWCNAIANFIRSYIFMFLLNVLLWRSFNLVLMVQPVFPMYTLPPAQCISWIPDVLRVASLSSELLRMFWFCELVLLNSFSLSVYFQYIISIGRIKNELSCTES